MAIRAWFTTTDLLRGNYISLLTLLPCYHVPEERLRDELSKRLRPGVGRGALRHGT